MLAESERDALASLLLSLGAAPTFWAPAPPVARTYVRCEVETEPGDASTRLAAAGAARIDLPPLAVLEIAPAGGAGLARLAAALGGPGRPGGIISCERTAATLLIELDTARSSLDLAVALIDAELGGRERRIVPLLPLEDEVLARFAAARLGAPSFGANRIIETHAEALLRR
jgi:hypothetical protein